MKQIEAVEASAQLELIRPFFSVIISCYNSKKVIGNVLESLCQQNLAYNELEVIISDDCSTEPYEEIIQNYEDKLLIKRVSTEYNCCPSNTREAGLQAATGQWICFSDHDDTFIPGTLNLLKYRIENELNEQYYIVTGFINQNCFRDNDSVKNIKATESSGWTHGKFYNLDNLIKQFNIHFKKDLLSHEDIYFTTLINCTIEYIQSLHLDAGIYLDDLFTYVWYSHPSSLSHQNDKGVSFLEKHFIDYCKATGEVYLDCYYNNKLTWLRTKQCLIDTMLLYYFYSISFIYFNPDGYDKNNFEYIKNFYKKISKHFNLTIKEIWMKANENNCFSYKEAEKYSEIGTGPIVPPFTLSQWLEMISDENDYTYSIYYHQK